MKLDLNALKYLYDAIDKEDLKEQDITDYADFVDYVIGTIISNIEYDFGVDFYDYVDKNNFIESED